MKTLKLQQLPKVGRISTLIVGLTLWGSILGNAQPVQLSPGETTTIAIDGSLTDCQQQILIGRESFIAALLPVTTCTADLLDDPPLRMTTATALTIANSLADFSSTQDLRSAAKIIRTIEIPVPSEEFYSSTLRVQVATEVAWSGVLIAAGAKSTYAQITATLRIRDVTDSPSGPVVASDTFFAERFDASLDLEIPTSISGLAQLLNLVDAVDVSASSGTDVTAYLQRGRTYAIELEAKCEAGAPAFGFSVCLFSASALTDLGLTGPLEGVLANDGFSVAPFEVVVESDPVQDLVAGFSAQP